MEKALICLLLSCVATLGHVLKEGRVASAGYTKAYSSYSQSGYYYTFTDYVNDLSAVGFNNAICSVQQTGMWMYYENKEYNKYNPGKVYWVHGIDIKVNFPSQYCGITSSLKYGGNRHQLNEDSYTVYSGEYFTGDEFYGNINAPDLTVVDGASSSLILTGKSPWTFYSGFTYTGQGYCFYPSTDEDHGSDGTVLNFGLYPSLTAVGVPDNLFRSAAKGCLSRVIINASNMKPQQTLSHGAWGVFNMETKEEEH